VKDCFKFLFYWISTGCTNTGNGASVETYRSFGSLVNSAIQRQALAFVAFIFIPSAGCPVGVCDDGAVVIG